MKPLFLATFAVAFISLFSINAAAQNKFPVVDQKGKIAVVCHRGWWKCEAAGMSENTIASLKAAQDAGFWGSECDVHITADGVVIVNHNKDINGKLINKHNFADFKDDLLPNGERRPSLDEYLVQTAKCKKTKLIIELKQQSSQELESALVEKTIEAVKAHGLFNPKRIIFITFSNYMCDVIAEKYPKFINQYLSSKTIDDVAPEKIAGKGINGIDYQKKVFFAHPEWVKRAQELEMSVNVWTVNDAEEIKTMIDLGVDAITTNEPDLVRQLLGDRELKAGK